MSQTTPTKDELLTDLRAPITFAEVYEILAPLRHSYITKLIDAQAIDDAVINETKVAPHAVALVMLIDELVRLVDAGTLTRAEAANAWTKTAGRVRETFDYMIEHADQLDELSIEVRPERAGAEPVMLRFMHDAVLSYLVWALDLRPTT
jgi:hypothetical protein